MFHGLDSLLIRLVASRDPAVLTLPPLAQDWEEALLRAKSHSPDPVSTPEATAHYSFGEMVLATNYKSRGASIAERSI